MDHTRPVSDQRRFENALSRFDQENSQDPNREAKDGAQLPREMVYAERLTDWVLRLKSKASEALLLAARSAHLCRWMIPRDSFPPDRSGYLRWRQELKKFHAAKVGQILREVGYEESEIAEVQGLVSKSAFPADPDSRILEDALCLVFLQWQFAGLAAKNSDEKMINAVQKTWKKMTPLAQDFALKLDYSPHEREILERALGPL
jgi:hypothetical protein